MDEFANLPAKNDTVKTPEEQAIMNQLFPSEDKPQQKPKSKLNWKVLGYSSILFLLLANPWIDKLLCKIPYCGENAIMVLSLKLFLFLLVLVLLNLFFP